MARLVLHIDPEVDFELWAMVTPLPEYRLCYFVNKVCSLSLAKINDLSVWLPKGKSQAVFSVYGWADEADHADYFLFANRSLSHRHLLIPEVKQADYFLMVKGAPPAAKISQVIGRIHDIHQVQTIFPVNAVALHSVSNLIFDNEDLYKNQNTGNAWPGFQ